MQYAARFGLCSSATTSESRSQSGSAGALGFALGQDAGVNRPLAQSGKAFSTSPKLHMQS